MVLKAGDVKLERGESPELGAAGMEGRKFCSMQAGRPGSERGTERMCFWGDWHLLQGKDRWGRYLTLRVLSSLDQESVEGKEGRDEEEVTNALLPI